MKNYNLPNKLTISRLILVIPFIVCLTMYKVSISINNMGYEIYGRIFLGVSLLIFMVAMFTDYLDGHYARKNKTITEFGKLWDPLADKIITTTALLFLVGFRMVPVWILLIHILRDLIVDGARVVMAKYNIELSASIWGKLKTLFLSFGIIVVMGFYTGFSVDAHLIKHENQTFQYWLDVIVNHSLNIFIILSVFFSIYSGVLYLKSIWPYLSQR
ncbi:CDP-diacylglycerol--glycerol-3-phosphate 3-phosphatidyltransferase [Mycoplasmopsis californica]|uniref:CDP-diacylglycerol--glycerol-3-phosphate 3-phosphatidyltransferase n=1 Tax=Mycoplasmopsis equigenitalium TaxID=114883 RepID=A0ABY5J2Y4_9BACT|nr:CDP-diacylglycerol--glycerol-3-phosphate 3-phosphatidyltransferase [Mycoplasmopsis equigenitalium]UUD36896.1 CDP-diacylglycerol--glycerol-3-phosphate 3-phosphatidyltransferase [Mycoplasmopsis equigenitalium]VEU69809.1 CDP-diacylglycerol--glycerol-3-phosphate 3-phosphatidyltransferase [Mycoplasmopsis californica]